MTDTTDRWGVARPIRTIDRLADKARTIPRIQTASGKPRPIEEQPLSVQSVATVGGAPYTPPTPPVPELGASIVKVAQEMRVDPLALLADEPFTTGIIGHDPSDLEGIGQAIAASAVKPKMRPNPAQGTSGQPQPVTQETPAEKIARASTHSRTGGHVAGLL
jgi:hypothetical protein